jgi:hypothetical protein
MSDKPSWVMVPANHAALIVPVTFPCCPPAGCDCKPEQTD